jgi:hypothetical protein
VPRSSRLTYWPKGGDTEARFPWRRVFQVKVTRVPCGEVLIARESANARMRGIPRPRRPYCVGVEAVSAVVSRHRPRAGRRWGSHPRSVRSSSAIPRRSSTPMGWVVIWPRSGTKSGRSCRSGSLTLPVCRTADAAPVHYCAERGGNSRVGDGGRAARYIRPYVRVLGPTDTPGNRVG